VERNSNATTEQELVSGKLVHLALPIRWSRIGEEGRGSSEIACTYDIHPRGARLVSARAVRAGDLILVERGRNKATCRVMWAADPDSPLRGQFTIQCVDGRTPWDDELRQQLSTEQYQPLILDEVHRKAMRDFGRSESNRRRRPRFYAEGQAEVIDGAQRAAGEVEQISEYGARIMAIAPMQPGTDFRLMLNMFDVSVALKAQVKYQLNDLGMGVEFHEIRRGDRPLLSYVLSKLKSRRVEEFARVEVITEPLVAAV
jgi:hypothetical protein